MTLALMPRYAAGTSTLGRWSALAIGGSIPVSVALDNILLAATLTMWIIGTQHASKLKTAWCNPVYRAALLLFFLLLLGTFYGNPAPGDAGLYLSKYLELAMIAVLGWSFVAARDRMIALHMLAGALALVLLMSYALKAGLTPQSLWLHGTPENPIVFKSRLTHNILMAFAAYLYATLCFNATTRFARLGWGALGIMAIINIALMVDGVTGYILLIVLTLLFSWQRAGLRGVGLAITATLITVAILSAVPGPFQTRIKQIYSELGYEHANRPATTSSGYRLEFYRNTLTLIRKSPVFGAGTGSFPAEYAGIVAGSGQNLSRNPHNEFMLITVQTGLIGLAAFLWLLWQQWRLVPELPTPLERNLAQGLVLMMVTICMLNSALLDHTEGLLYAWLTALLYAGLKSDA